MSRLGKLFSQVFGEIFVVSLRRSVERRVSLAAHMDDLGVDCYSFFDATDASDPIVGEWVDSGRVHQYPPCFRCGQLACGQDDCNNVLIPSQVATFLSHYRLWQHIAGSNHDRALVIEDDVRFHPWAERVLNEIVESFGAGPFSILDSSGSHLLRLGWAQDHEHVDTRFATTTSIRMSNPCYAITRGAARIAARSLKRIETTVDVFLHRDLPSHFDSALTVLPPIASELSWSYGTLRSEIHPKSKHLEYLQNHDRAEEARLYSEQITQHVAHVSHCELLFVGHPRCGSKFAADLCNEVGLEVGHEDLGGDGVSSWMFAVDANPVPFFKDSRVSTRKRLHWNRLIQFVRNPFAAIPSIMVDDEHSAASREFRHDQIRAQTGMDLNEVESPVERAAWSLLCWSSIIENQEPDLWFRIEEPKTLLAYLRRAQLLSKNVIIDDVHIPPSNTNNKYHGIVYPKPRLKPVDFFSLSERCRMELSKYCAKYGYAFEFPGFREKGLSEFGSKGLAPIGWFKSLETQIPMNGKGELLPWLTYSAIEFLANVVSKTDQVFEYGAGWSTIWWANNVRRIVSVEHDEQWIQNIGARMPENVDLRFRPIDLEATENAKAALHAYLDTQPRINFDYQEDRRIARGLADERFAAYAHEIVEEPDKFDVVVIDGMARRLCAHVAADRCKETGLIVFDNTNRSDYREAYDFLGSRGYRQVNFWGPVPGAPFNSCTSVFIRTMDRIPIGTFKSSILGIREY